MSKAKPQNVKSVNNVVEKKEDIPEKVAALSGGRMGLAEAERTYHVATSVAGTPFKHALKPEYWANYGTQLRPFDIIEFRSEEGTYWAQLLVVDCGNNWASVEVLVQKNLTKIKEDKLNLFGCEVSYSGAVDQYRVVRESDKKVLSRGNRSMEAAVKWLTENKQVAA